MKLSQSVSQSASQTVNQSDKMRQFQMDSRLNGISNSIQNILELAGVLANGIQRARIACCARISTARTAEVVWARRAKVVARSAAYLVCHIQ